MSKTVAEESMKQAACYVIEEQDGGHETMVFVDGSWQRRGHSSHNGVVSAINVATGKVLDVGALSNYCKGCAQWSLEQQLTSQYSAWKSTHICRLNHDGSAGSMEPKRRSKNFRKI